MGGDTRGYALDVSEHFFRLTTESLRLHSNETRRLQTLASLVNARAAQSKMTEMLDAATIRDHLVAIPTRGDIRINLRITRSSADTLAKAKERLTTMLGTSLTMGDALSVLLFDYVAEQKTSVVLQRLDLDETKEKRGKPSANDSHQENVIRLK